MEVKIYALIDPNSMRVRYIGRTKSSLVKRLSEHVSKSRLNYNNTHKSNWIKSLLKVNSKPYIRQLCVVDGWKESHDKERALIHKYRDRLLNHDDRGEGSKNHIVGEEYKRAISDTLKAKYASGELKNPSSKQVHVYNLHGDYLSSYESGADASTQIGIAYSAIYKCTSGLAKQYAGYQFSLEKVDSMPTITKKSKVIHNQAVQRTAV